MPSKAPRHANGKASPIAKPNGDLQNIAAQYDEANMALQKAAQRGAGDGKAQVAKDQKKIEERGRKKAAAFKRAWGWSVGFFAWLLCVSSTLTLPWIFGLMAIQIYTRHGHLSFHKRLSSHATRP